MSALPQRLIGVRDFGEAIDPYQGPATEDGIHLTLEAGECEPLTGARVDVSASGAESWSLPDQTLVLVTNRRLVWLSTSFEKGGGWVGGGAAGIAIALTANAVSKHRVAKRTAGRVALGHIRHEWVTEVRLRKRKALIGLVDTFVDIRAANASGPVTLALWGKQLANESFARWLVTVASVERLRLAGAQMQPAQRDALEALAQPASGGGWGTGAEAGSLRWELPGDTAMLLDRGIRRVARSQQDAP